MPKQLMMFKDDQPSGGSGKPAKETGKGAAPQQKNARRSQQAFNGYIRCELTKHDKDPFNEYRDRVGNDGAYEWLLDMAEKRYKVSFGYRDDSAIASLSCQDEEDSNYGYVLTAFGGDTATAVFALMYKHAIKLEGDWDNGKDGGDWQVH